MSVYDRDVILVREGLAFNALAGYYDPDEPTLGPLCGVPVTNPIPAFPAVPPIPSTLTSTMSEEGCNYTAVVEFTSPLLGSITINRGFVGVDVNVEGKDYRVVNTHLEVREIPPGNTGTRIIPCRARGHRAKVLFPAPAGIRPKHNPRD